MDFGIKCQILKRSTGTRQRERKGENEWHWCKLCIILLKLSACHPNLQSNRKKALCGNISGKLWSSQTYFDMLKVRTQSLWNLKMKERQCNRAQHSAAKSSHTLFYMLLRQPAWSTGIRTVWCYPLPNWVILCELNANFPEHCSNTYIRYELFLVVSYVAKLLWM
jgi:hypothetical protein